jgi:hypothetical protein
LLVKYKYFSYYDVLSDTEGSNITDGGLTSKKQQPSLQVRKIEENKRSKK